MGQTVKLRRSAISGKIPNNSQLELGELSMNTTDGKIFLSKSGSQGPSVEEVIITNTQNTGNLDIVGSISGSLFTGSYIGDGSGLYNIPASGVTGLSLDQISNGASTASIDADGLQINVDTSVTGSLTATEFTGSGLGLTNVPLALSGSDASDTSIDGTFTRIKFDESTGIKISGTTGGDATVFLSGVAAESESSEGRTAKLTVTGATSTWTLTHNLNERHPSVEVFDSNDEVIIPQKIEATSNNQIVVTFATPQTGTVTATVGGGLPSIESGYVGRVLSVDSSGVATWKDTILSGSIDFSTLTDTGSFNTYTSSANDRLDSLETESGSIRTDFNSYTSSNDSTNTTQNNRIGSLESTSGSHDGRLDSLETESGSIRTDFNTYTSSNNTTNTNQDGRLDSLEEFTSSIDDTYATDTDVTGLRNDLNSYTSSNNTTNTTQNNRLSSIESFTGSIDNTYATDADVTNLTNTLNTYTSSNDTTNTTQNSRLSSLETKTGSLDSDISTLDSRVDSLEIKTGSLDSDITTLDGRLDSLETESGSIRTDFNSHTSSINGRVDSVENKIDSLQTESGSIRSDFNSYTSSNDSTNTTQNNKISSLETTSGSHNTRLTNLETFETKVDNGLEFTGSNVTIKGNLLVKGTETRVNSTTVDIDDNIISLNGNGAANAGIEVRDTTSPGVLSGSLVWDGSNNYWKAGQKGSEERILLNTDLTTLDGRLDSLETESGSIRSTLNTYTSSNDTLNTTQNSRLSSLETKTGSLDSDISTLDGRVDSLEIKTGSLDGDISTLDGRVDSLETESGSIRTDFNTYTSSNDTTNSTQDGRLSSLETFTGSIDNTYATDQDVTDLRGDFNTYTSSNDNTNNTQNNRLNSLETTSGSHGGRIDSLEEFTASIDNTYATDQDVTDLRSDLNSYTSSNNTTNTTQNNRLSSLETFTGSIDNTYATDQDVTDLRSDLNSYTSSNDSTNTTQNNRLSSIESVTGSFITGYTETQNLDDVTTLGSSTTNSISVGGLDSTGAISISSTNVIDTNRRIYGSGTASNTTPAFTFAGDTNTGLSRIGTDAVGLVAAGSRKFYVSSTHAYFQNLPSGVTINGAGLTVEGDTTITGSTTAGSFVKSGGTSSQFLKADGSVDTNTYLTQHPTISASSSSNNSGRTYIQDILLDGNGHVTGITTGTETVTNINYYVDGLSFDTGTGVLTASVNGTTNQTVDLDGRYSLTSHNHNIWDLPFTRSSINIDTVGSNNIWDYIHSTSTTDGTYPTTYMHIVSFGDRSHGLQFGSPYSSNTNLYYRQGTDNGASENGANTYKDWKKIWSERDFTSTQVSNWDTAYGWGDHSQAGYITSQATDFVSKSGGGQFDDVIIIKENTATTGTNGKSFLTLHNENSDISQQQSFIDFKFTDTNANYTPQVRIGAQVGPDADANAISKEGAGSFVVYTAPVGSDESGNSSGLAEQFRVSYNGTVTAQGQIVASGGNSSQWNTAYGWGDHSTVGYLTGYTDTYLTGATFSANTLTLTKNDGNDVTVSLNALVDVTVTGGSYNDSTQTLTLNKSDSNSIDITGFTIDTNTLLTGATFDDSDGIITLTKNNGDTVTVDIDGRFLQLGGGTLTGDLTLNSVNPQILFNGTSDTGVDMAIKATPEGLDFYEPEDSNKIHFQILDDTGVNAAYGLQVGGTSVISSSRVLQNVTGNISMFTNDSGYITGYSETDTLATVTSRGATTTDNITTGNHTISHTGPTLTLDDNNNAGGGGATGKIIFKNTAGNAIGIGYTADDTSSSDLIISTNAGSTYGGYLGLDAGGISDTQADIILDPKTKVQVKGDIDMGTNDITDTKVGQWDTAYGWGDHSQAGYITGYTETDTLATVTSRGATTTSDITTGNITTTKENAAPTITFHNGGTDMGTNADIAQLNFTADYQGSSIPYGSIEVKTNASSVRTDIDFIVKSTSGNQETALKLQGGSGKPKSFFYNDMDVTGTITASGKGTFDNLELTSGARHLTFTQSSDDWFIYNDQQDNGIVLYNGTGGVEIHYSGSSIADFDSTGITLRSSVSTTSTLDVAGWATVGSLLVSNTAPYIDLVDTNSFTDANDRFRIRAAGNVGQIKWYDDSAGSDSLLMTFNPDGTIGVEGDIDMGTNTITDTKVGQWDTAYGWGDHGTVGYITGYTETDTLDSVVSRGSSTTSTVSVGRLNIGSTVDSSFLTGDSKLSADGYIMTKAIVNTSETGTGPAAIVFGNGSTYGSDEISFVTVGNTRMFIDSNSVDVSVQLNMSADIDMGTNTITDTKVGQWDTAYGWGNHSGLYMTQGQTYSTSPNIINNGGNRYDPSADSPTNEHYAILTYGNGGNVTGQLATHFVTGKLYSRGHNNAWSGWRAYWSDSDFTSANVSNWNTAYTYSQVGHLPLAGGTLTGDLTVGSTSRASDTVIRALSDDSHKSGFEAYGSGQGNGYLYVGQSTTHGGGISYNGDSSPAYVGGETSDYITFYRREAGTNTEVFAFPYSSNEVYFNGNVHSGGGNSSQWNTAYGWGDHASVGYTDNAYADTMNQHVRTSDSPTFNDMTLSGDLTVNGNQIFLDNVQSRTKLMVWSGNTYGIGMESGYTYGHIGNDYVMSFQMSDTNDRGFWWGDTGHSNAQGAMSLTTQGKATIATSLSIGQGQSVTSPSDTPLYVEGTTSGSTVFEVQGTQGQLFSISDSLVGDIFEVSDISGIPILSVNSNGTVTIDDTLQVTGEVFAYYSSDERLKDNVKPIENAIDKIKMIGGYEFDWNSLSRTNSGHDVGVIAQEIEKVLPEVVTTKNDGFKGVRYEKLTSLLIQANKELIQRVEELEEKLNKSE